eukprot:UN07299
MRILISTGTQKAKTDNPRVYTETQLGNHEKLVMFPVKKKTNKKVVNQFKTPSQNKKPIFRPDTQSKSKNNPSFKRPSQPYFNPVKKDHLNLIY